MKRFFFSLIALSAAAIGCTQSAMLETPALEGVEVSFSPYTGRTPVTKATSIVGPAGLAADGFRVYSILNKPESDPSVYLEDELVSSTDGANWSYVNKVYWPTSEGTTLDFVAYSANAANLLTADDETGFTFKVPESVGQQVDLLATAYQSGKTLVSDGKVNLHFYHLLSRIGFKIQTTSTSPITIKSISLEGKMPDAGTLEYKDYTGEEIPSLTPTVQPANYQTKTYFYLNNAEIELAEGATNATSITGLENEYLMIMPHNASPNSGHKVSVTYQIGSKEQTATADLPADFVFAQGMAYEFILKISTSALTFEVTEQGWYETGVVPEPEEPEEPEEEGPEVVIPEQFPEVDQKTAEDLGIVFNIVKYEQFDGNKHLLTVKIDVVGDTPNGAVGLAISFRNKVGDELGSWKGGSLTTKTTSGNDTATTHKKGNSYIRYYSSTSNLVPNADEVTVCCHFYKTATQSTSNHRTPIRENPAYHKKFSTLTPFDYTDYYFPPEEEPEDPSDPENPEEPVLPAVQPSVSIESLSVNAANKTAAVAATFVEGSSPVAEYGFCWNAGTDVPTVENTHIKCTGSFSYTITGLSEGMNICRAYVITQDGLTYYSPARNIEIEKQPSENDNTGGGNWEEGGGDGDDTEIEF